MNRAILFISILLNCVFISCQQNIPASSDRKEPVTIVTPQQASVRVVFGAERLKSSLEDVGYEVSIVSQNEYAGKGRQIIVGLLEDTLIRSAIANGSLEKAPGKEGFAILSEKGKTIVGGADASGTLYGCLELADQVKKQGELPAGLQMVDQPKMMLRGACIGVQKTAYLPGRTVYEYPYTPENFPWFYNKELWVQYLDMLVENRMNSLYLWNGHPFASLVKLNDYPYAVEVDEETFRKNEEMFRFLTTEADKRGIWVIQMFYNILVSKPFAEKHGIKTQDRSRPIMPVIADYTQKSIAAFVEKYPNVGLLITLGEAMEGDEADVEWFTKTIIPGVQDGLKALGTSTEPPIVLRGHDTNPQLVMQAALPLYRNLYTMNKYNGEALTTYEPRGPWAQMHRDLSQLGSTHIDNVHILANLEPFRYGSADFIQKSVQAMLKVHGANGLHLYPESSYWDWPYTADKTSPRLLQIDRDWIWYKAWARYAWNSNRDRENEIAYWSDLLGNRYGSGEHSKYILEAYEQTGEIAPKLLRRFGITNGNRQTLTLGMFMSQLVNPHKWRVWPELYNSDGPAGEMLIEYAEKEWKKEPHIGETPPRIIEEVVAHGQLAVEAIEKAAPHVSKNEEEFARLRNDIYCYRALSDFFSEKVKAAALVLKYNYSNNISDLEMAVPHLEKSISHYQELVDLTKDTYLYANSMQTAQRRVPIGGDDGKNKTWVELLPYYEQELENFRKNIQLLKPHESEANVSARTVSLQPADVTLLHDNVGYYTVEKGQEVFTDQDFQVMDAATELKNLKGVKLSMAEQVRNGTTIHFKSAKPVKVLVGFFKSSDKSYLAPPDLETNASANAYGQSEVKLANAVLLPGLPPVNVHSYAFGAGEKNLKLGKGACLILGFVEGSQAIAARDVDFGAKDKKGIDWLFDK
jgi:hypothetical protein